LKEWQFALSKMTHEERRIAEKEIESGLTAHERNVRRFDFLKKNAPMTADYVKDMEVVHKPFAKLVRNVRCLKCGKWGHRIGDRECELNNNIFSIIDNTCNKPTNEKEIEKEKDNSKENNNENHNDNKDSINNNNEDGDMNATSNNNDNKNNIKTKKEPNYDKEDPLIAMKFKKIHDSLNHILNDENEGNYNNRNDETVSIYTFDTAYNKTIDNNGSNIDYYENDVKTANQYIIKKKL